MALVNRSFQLDITPGAIPQVIKVSEYDVNRAYTVTLIDEGGVFEIPSGTTAKVEGSIGGNGFSENASISGDTITFTLTESMTAKAGDVWCKIKLTKDSKPIQSCAFILRCDRAGVEAETILHSPGFQEHINEGIAEYFDNDPPFFELPSGGQSGQALLSDGADGAYWGQAQGGGTGLSDDVKQALLDCFENVAWVNDDGQTYYDALYAALYPPVDLLFISAIFTQGSAVIYDTDSLDTLKQYLVVTATMSDSTTRTVTNYTLSGTLTVGTSTITVSYGGKTDTFTVAVSEKQYQLCEYVETDGASRIDTGVQFDGTKDIEVTIEASFAKTLTDGQNTMIGWSAGGAVGVVLSRGFTAWTDGADNPSAATHLSGINLMTEINMVIQAGSATNTISTFTNTNGTKTLTRTHTNVENRTFLPFPLFALSLQDSFDYTLDGFRIKSAIIKVGGTVVRNLKACYRKSDNVIGFFDETNSVFYTNAGTGAFTKGGDIS